MRSGILIMGIIFVLLGVFYYKTDSKSGASARAHIIEKWFVIEDTSFTREFFADGTLVDSKKGVTVKRNWALFTKRMPIDGIPFELEDNAQYLSLAAPKGEIEYYKIDTIDASNLVLTDLRTKKTVSFMVAP